jgi:arylsulfatase A-like enzyme
VRDGDWKLIENYEDGSAALFNLREDPCETNDLAAQQPERAKELLSELAAWRARLGAQNNSANQDFDAARHAELYQDVDVSRYDPATADAAMKARMKLWRQRMNEALAKP